jgi:hypothetical protein
LRRAAQPFTFHLLLKNLINPLKKRAITRDDHAANHSHGPDSVPVMSAGDRLTVNRLSSAPRELSPPPPVLGTFTARGASWEDIVDSHFENILVVSDFTAHD